MIDALLMVLGLFGGIIATVFLGVKPEKRKRERAERRATDAERTVAEVKSNAKVKDKVRDQERELQGVTNETDDSNPADGSGSRFTNQL